jgi:hypoxanthine-DNA glycosylase
MLLSFGIGLWDVLYTATRKSSLDSDIKDGVPNDIDTFIANHKKLKIIGFNGKKAEELYDRHFDRNPDLTYLTLPSTSSANTTLTLSQMCRAWKQVIK